MYRGRLAEHVVGQELLAADRRTNAKPRFWVRQKPGATAEVDYVHRYRDRLVPVEVKSGKSGALRSLHQFMRRADHDLAVRLWDGDIDLHPAKTPDGRGFRLLNLPYFLVHRLDDYLDWAERQGSSIG
ncbi:MAG: DUF4143 domain-containing protein [Acidobacteria bacterium]|nr:DUF4143 domain-containing protein [Acidobacteriota bacterium]